MTSPRTQARLTSGHRKRADVIEPDAISCVSYKVVHGVTFRCCRPFRHSGRHRWKVDLNIYPFGRLDPDDPIDQAIVRAWNKGAPSRRGGR
jgi:hypothetical protein